MHAIEATLVGVFGDENARRIVVRGCDGRWLYVGDGCRAGKQAHMASAGAQLYCALLMNNALLYCEVLLYAVCCVLYACHEIC